MAVAEGLVLHLDKEQKVKLEEVSRLRGLPVSTVVRQLIDTAYEDDDRERRREAARRIGEMEIEDVPDPETLNRQSESTYGIEPIP